MNKVARPQNDFLSIKRVVPQLSGGTVACQGILMILSSEVLQIPLLQVRVACTSRVSSIEQYHDAQLG